MSIQDNKRIVRSEFEEIWNQGKLDLISTYFSADFINFGRPCPLDRLRQIMEAWRTTFPDMHYTVDAQIAEGDRVLRHCTLSGTHLSPFVLLQLWSLPPLATLLGEADAPPSPPRRSDCRTLGCAGGFGHVAEARDHPSTSTWAVIRCLGESL